MGLKNHDENVVRKGWDMVDRNQNRISALVMDMLTFSKEREPDPVPSNLNEVVSEVIELARSRAAECNVKLDWTPAAEMPTLTFDPEGIHRAVLNVVTNALDACDKGETSCVRVSTQYDSGQNRVRVIVEDNGVGIAADEIDKIFTIFMSQKGNRGTGLGLPVSQKILKEHGGDVRVESEVGKGSRFILEFPAASSVDSDIKDTGHAESVSR
jgi:signal transduction histidine kinase